MSMIYIWIKDIFLAIIPFVLANLFFKHFYQTNIFSVATWWYKYHSDVDYRAPLFIGLVFSFFAFWATIGFIGHTVSVAFHGETHTLLYIGDIEDNKSVFVKPKNIKMPIIEFRDFIGSSPYTFKNIFKRTKFLRDKGTDRLGAPVANFSFGNVLVSLSAMLILIPILLVVLHNFAYLVQIKAETLDFEPPIPTMDAFTSLLSNWNLTPYRLVFFSLGMLVTTILLNNITPKVKNVFGYRAIELPRVITPNHEMSVLPVAYKTHIIHISGSPETDTGYRTITFKVEKEFPIPVYISYYFKITSRPELATLALKNIKLKKEMQVRVLDNLMIEVID